jgi:hypothetical protein
MGASLPSAAITERAVFNFNLFVAGLNCLATLLLWIGRFRRAQAAAGLPRAGASKLQRPYCLTCCPS